jgi:prepilin-type processing-associated H-X9-DG protein
MPFPNSPSNGQTYVLNNTSYTYNAAQGTWTATQAGVSTPIVIAANTAATSTGTGALQVVGGIGVQGNVYTANVGFADGSVFGSASSLGTRNRIINGTMVIDQRNAGANVTPTGNSYNSCDRWQMIMTQSSKFSVQQNAGSVTPPTGFTNYLGFTSLAATTIAVSDIYYFRQIIEGYNISDLAWGTSNAKAITLSFYVRSSLTGTFSGSFQDTSGSVSYVFTYSIPSANTWTQITLNIPGPTTGTWGTTNTAGMFVDFNLGAGTNFNTSSPNTWLSSSLYSTSTSTNIISTNGATFYITGVQLEQGSVATPFERRQFGQELLLCQRYYQVSGRGLGGVMYSTSYCNGNGTFPVQMRASPTVALIAVNPSVSVYGTGDLGKGSGITINSVNTGSGPGGFYFQLQGYTGGTDNRGWTFSTDNVFSLSSEL